MNPEPDRCECGRLPLSDLAPRPDGRWVCYMCAAPVPPSTTLECSECNGELVKAMLGECTPTQIAHLFVHGASREQRCLQALRACHYALMNFKAGSSEKAQALRLAGSILGL